MTDAEYLNSVLASQFLGDDSPEMKALSNHRADVEAILNQKFAGSKFRFGYGGSKIKGTLIAESFDLDLVFYVLSGENGVGATLADIYLNVANALRPSYDLREKTSAIRLRSNEKATLGQDFHIDVVPGRFIDETEQDCYLYQKGSDKDRLKTNLKTHIAHIKGSGVLDALRLLKLLRVRRSVGLKQFIWELLCVDLLRGHHSASLSDQLKIVLRRIAESERAMTVEDPANPTGNNLNDELASEWAMLRSMCKGALGQLSSGGWQEVFQVAQAPQVNRVERIARVAAAAPISSRPWSNEP